jgi:hypothetical protein
MKTKNMTTSQLRNTVKRSPLRYGLFLIPLVLAAFATAANAYTFTPISLCPSCSTLPIGITANGLISGLYFDADGNLHAFVARNGNYLTVDVPGALFTEAGRSNERGQTAGDYLAADGIDRPFVRNRDGSLA